MSEKIILFEIEKGELANLTWTEEDATHNIWSAPITLSPGKSDIDALNDSTFNSYRKLYAENELEKNKIVITFRGRYGETTLTLADNLNTPNLIAEYIRNNYNPGDYFTISGSNNEIVFTSTVAGSYSGLDDFFSREGNISGSWVVNVQGNAGSDISNEIDRIPLPNPTDENDWWQDYIYRDYHELAGKYINPLFDSSSYYNVGDKVYFYDTGSTWHSYECIQSTDGFRDPTTIGYWSEIPLGAPIPACKTVEYTLILRDKIWNLITLGTVSVPYGDYEEEYNLSGHSYGQEFRWYSIVEAIVGEPVSGIDYDNYSYTHPEEEKLEGPLSFQENIYSGLVFETPYVVQEGGSQTIAPVQQVQTLTINSYNTNYRTFFYDKTNELLYVRLPYGDDPSDFYWNTSLKQGYSNFEGYYDPLNSGASLFYEGRLINIPNISYKKDSTYYSLVSFDGGNIVLNNTDGFFDNLDEEDVYGQICTLRYSDGGPFQTIYTGYFESFQLNGIPGQLIANVYDKRKVFSNKMPNNYFRIEDYPYLNSANDGLPIPVGFGKINKATAICLNEMEKVSEDPVVLPDYFTFKICDDTVGVIQSVDTVYFEGEEVTPENVNLTTCTFQLPKEVYVPGKFVSVSYHGLAIENPIEVLEFILEKWAGLLKTSFNYNLVEWNAARDKVGIPMIGLHIAENKTMIDIIGEISNSVFGTFLIQKDGLITFKIRDVTLDPVATIRVDDQIEAPIQNYRSDEYANSIRVGHSKAWSNGKSSWVTIDDQEEALFNRYRVNAGKEVSTLLSSKADAITYGDSLYLQYAGIFPTFTIRTKTQFLDLALEDIIDVEVYLLPDGSFGTVRLEVLGVDADLNSNTVTITGRYVSMGGTYIGKKLIKYLAR